MPLKWGKKSKDDDEGQVEAHGWRYSKEEAPEDPDAREEGEEQPEVEPHIVRHAVRYGKTGYGRTEADEEQAENDAG